MKLPVTLRINQLPVWNGSSFSPIISTYFFGSSIPTAFVAVPPKEYAPVPQIPLLFLREYSAGDECKWLLQAVDRRCRSGRAGLVVLGVFTTAPGIQLAYTTHRTYFMGESGMI